MQGKYPYLTDKQTVGYRLYPKEIRESIYIPVASFITAYARKKTIETSQLIKEYTLEKYGKDLYLYSDTDSIHCLLPGIEENGEIKLKNDEELYKIVEIDEYNLGAWKIESMFKKAKFLRQKCYIELGIDEEMNVTVAGLPKLLGKLINFDNFKVGFTTENMNTDEKKLTYKHVKGGVLLVDTDFSIK